MQLSCGGNTRQTHRTLSSTARACYPSVLSLPLHMLHHSPRTTLPSAQGPNLLSPNLSNRFSFFHRFSPSLLSPMMQLHTSMLLRLTPRKTCSRYIPVINEYILPSQWKQNEKERKLLLLLVAETYTMADIYSHLAEALKFISA